MVTFKKMKRGNFSVTETSTNRKDVLNLYMLLTTRNCLHTRFVSLETDFYPIQISRISFYPWH